jgi:hypothetical protein
MNFLSLFLFLPFLAKLHYIEPHLLGLFLWSFTVTYFYWSSKVIPGNLCNSRTFIHIQTRSKFKHGHHVLSLNSFL